MGKNGILLIFIGIFFLSSCSLRNNENERVIRDSETLIEQFPDSVLRLLEIQVRPQELNEDFYNRYQLLYIQAKNKSQRDISGDTVIYRVRDYFIKKEDKNRSGLALFYSGRVLTAQDKKEKAMLDFSEAEVYAKQTGNDALRGLIHFYMGDLYNSQSQRGEAMTQYKQALYYFNKSGKYKNEIIVYDKIGSCFLIRGNLDSSFYYYNKSLFLADTHNDSEELVFIYLNIGISLEKSGELKQARDYYRRSILYAKNDEEKAKVYLNIAYSFNEEENKDSTLYYFNKSLDLVKDKDSSKLSLNIYHLLTKISEKEGDYKQALKHNREYARHLQKALKESNEQAVLDVQKKYDFELIRNENNQLLIEKQSAFLVILGLIIILLILMIISYRKDVKNRETLLDAEQKISYLKDMADSFDEKENSFRKVLFQHFNILKKVALLEGNMKAEEKKQGRKLLDKFNEIVYNQGALDWNMLYTTMDQLYKGFPDSLREAYPQLDEIEFRICCLIYAGLSNTEMSVIMELTVSTIQSRKSAIRKKLNMDGYGNIMDFLSQNII